MLKPSVCRLSRGDRITVCVIGQNRLVTDYLIQECGRDPDVTPVRFQDFIATEQETRSCLVFVFDACGIALPITQCMRDIAIRYPAAGCILLVADTIKQVMSSLLNLGPHGLICYDDVRLNFGSAIRAVAAGRVWLSPSLGYRPRSPFSDGPTRAAVSHTTVLSPRESEVVLLAKQRLTNKEIAAVLAIEESTVKFHIGRVFAKLNISGREELIDSTGLLDSWTRSISINRSGARSACGHERGINDAPA